MMLKIQEIQKEINELVKNDFSVEKLSDGFHSFEELYQFRISYNAALFNEWHLQNNKYGVHKSIRHFDGEMCFGGGWFVVCASLPSGQITNHYKIKFWDFFQIPEERNCLLEFDGHTSADVLERLKAL